MGLWQVGFFVLPSESIRNKKIELDNEGTFDDAPYWGTQTVQPDVFKSLAKILPLNESWSKNIFLYGNQESNRLEVFHENGYVRSVSFRIDFTSNYEEVLSELIEFFILDGLTLLDEKLNLLPLNFESVKNTIETSSQLKKYKSLMSE